VTLLKLKLNIKILKHLVVSLTISHLSFQETCNIATFLQILCGVFGEALPVYSKATEQSPPTRSAHQPAPSTGADRRPRSADQQTPFTGADYPPRATQQQHAQGGC